MPLALFKHFKLSVFVSSVNKNSFDGPRFTLFQISGRKHDSKGAVCHNFVKFKLREIWVLILDCYRIIFLIPFYVLLIYIYI
jgi:hypothetical protein